MHNSHCLWPIYNNFYIYNEIFRYKYIDSSPKSFIEGKFPVNIED